MPRKKREPRQCENDRCEKFYIPPRANSRYCSLACLRDVKARACINGHDLTLPHSTRQDGTRRICLKCEYDATMRYRRKKGILPREQYLEESRKPPEHHRERNRRNATKHRRRAGIQPRQKRTVSGTVRTEVTAAMHVKRELPTELSRAWGRAGHGSQMRRKFPTREALIAAYGRGELPMVYE